MTLLVPLAFVAGGGHTRRVERGVGGGQYLFWKTQDTALYSTYIESSLDARIYQVDSSLHAMIQEISTVHTKHLKRTPIKEKSNLNNFLPRLLPNQYIEYSLPLLHFCSPALPTGRNIGHRTQKVLNVCGQTHSRPFLHQGIGRSSFIII